MPLRQRSRPVWVVVSLAAYVLVVSCNVSPWTCPPSVDPPRVRTASAYPVRATPERAAAIRENYRRITLGMSAADVKALLGEPDEIGPPPDLRIHCSKVPRKPQTYQMTFIIQRLTPRDDQESTVTVEFSMDDRVLRVRTRWWDDVNGRSIQRQVIPSSAH